MNPARIIGRLARILAVLGAAVLAVTAAAAAALATPRPKPPGWNKHPPPPASSQHGQDAGQAADGAGRVHNGLLVMVGAVLR